jgi:hypothetical protein
MDGDSLDMDVNIGHTFQIQTYNSTILRNITTIYHQEYSKRTLFHENLMQNGNLSHFSISQIVPTAEH